MNSLIVITTCNRFSEFKKNILPYLQFCSFNEDFDFIVSLDGFDKEYICFCENFNIPLIWSERREGVGLSKNRVISKCPDYKYYFFIEDDVELVNSEIFYSCIELHKKTNYHHFSVNHTVGIIFKEVVLGRHLTHTLFGSGYFLFYTSDCLKVIGGWHDLFAKYMRYGHTEHTYRAYFSKMNPNPFIFFREANDMLILNDPVHVSSADYFINKNGLILEEQKMIDSKQRFYPICTHSAYHYNSKALQISQLPDELVGSRYSLLNKKEKNKALSVYYFHKFKVLKNPIYIIISFMYSPNYKLIKQFIKVKWLTFKLNHIKL
jgi:hypothetical protein